MSKQLSCRFQKINSNCFFLSTWEAKFLFFYFILYNIKKMKIVEKWMHKKKKICFQLPDHTQIKRRRK